MATSPFPWDCGLTNLKIDDFIGNNNIVHIFAQNCDYHGPSNKISYLPIGMDFHTVGYKNANGVGGERRGLLWCRKCN